MRIIHLLVLFAGMLGVSGCLPVIFGIKKIRPLAPESIQKRAKRIGIPAEDCYMIDTGAYKSRFMTVPDLKHRSIFYQPMQIRAYDSTGRLLTLLVNCQIGGFPMLCWNRYTTLDTFPMRPFDVYGKDTVIMLQEEMRYFKKMDGSPASVVHPGIEQTLVIYWSDFARRHSRYLVKTIKEYSAKFKGRRMKIIYVNMDNLLL